MNDETKEKIIERNKLEEEFISLINKRNFLFKEYNFYDNECRKIMYKIERLDKIIESEVENDNKRK